MKLTYENNPSEILDKLLEYHDIKVLKALLNKKVRKKKTRGNNYIDVSVDVYKLVYLEKYMLERAIDEVAQVRSISDKTIKNHLRKFRKLFKYGISDIGESDNVQTTQMVKDLILSKFDWQNDEFYDIDDEKEIAEFVSRMQIPPPPRYFPF
ncbi:hypothetical protein ACLHDG_08955 [Sulfurovum sp. CS9]|uniref:hypothetical protein n=1 Tax=Sulfurovum sp. CS9 TaxID=3391146 RepID=UPI0039ECFABC